MSLQLAGYHQRDHVETHLDLSPRESPHGLVVAGVGLRGGLWVEGLDGTVGYVVTGEMGVVDMVDRAGAGGSQETQDGEDVEMHGEGRSRTSE